MQMQSKRAFGALALAAVIVMACQGDSPTAPGASSPLPSATPSFTPTSTLTSAVVNNDLAAIAGNAIATDLTELASNANYSTLSSLGSLLNSGEKSSSTHPTGTPPKSDPPKSDPPKDGEKSGGTVGGSSCKYNETTKSHVCSEDKKETVSYSRSYTYLDAKDQAMEKFVAGVTASIRYITSMDGSISKDSTFSSVTHKKSDRKVSGLLGETRIWNGFGSSADTSVKKEGAASRTYRGTSVDSMKAITYRKESKEKSYPLSGSSVRVLNYTVVSVGKKMETTTVSQRVVVTFDGTSKAKIELGAFNCVLDLDSHKVSDCK